MGEKRWSAKITCDKPRGGGGSSGERNKALADNPDGWVGKGRRYREDKGEM